MIWMGTEGMMGFLTTDKLRHLAKQFWGDETAAEFDCPEKMGAAAAVIQNRAYAKENFVLCDFFWPIDYSGNTPEGVGGPSLEARVFSAVTGIDMDGDDFLASGERCLNLCRAIYMREGRRGREDDCLEEFNFSRPLEEQPPPVGLFNPDLVVPGENGEYFQARGSVVDREDFKMVMDEYYMARKWDVKTGLFTVDGLKELGMEDLLPELKQLGFIV
jgi:aldehyde:ferredoxin oxidoreductase